MTAKHNLRLVQNTGEKGKKKKKKRSPGHTFKLVTFGALAAVIILLLSALVLMNIYRVENIQVEGNVHYTADEIKEMVMRDKLSENSLYLSLKYKNKTIRDIPFIESMDVEVVSKDTIYIRVYEKAVAGYLEYLGRYIYFDREGIVVESSSTKTVGIPQVIGIDLDHVVLYEKLPVENDDIFQNILNITQILNKYGLTVDKIYFDDDYQVTLHFGNVRVRMGDCDYLEEKVIRLQYILPKLEGKSGVLDLESYNGGDENITFKSDKE